MKLSTIVKIIHIFIIVLVNMRNLLIVSLKFPHTMSYFSLAFWTLLSLCIKILITMCLSVNLCIHFTWSLLSLWNVYFYLFLEMWEIFSHYFPKHSLPLFPVFSYDSQNVCVGSFGGAPQFLGFCFLSFNHFPFCSSDMKISWSYLYN